MRDAVIDFVVHWHKQTGICIGQFLSLLGLSKSTYYDWKARYGAPNGSYASLPKTSWLLDWEKQAIITYALAHPDQGYRRLAYQMIDEDVVAVSPSSVYRVLKGADLLGRTLKEVSKKGTGFDQPTGAHQHWHVDVSYLNICGGQVLFLVEIIEADRFSQQQKRLASLYRVSSPSAVRA